MDKTGSFFFAQKQVIFDLVFFNELVIHYIYITSKNISPQKKMPVLDKPGGAGDIAHF